MAIARIEFVGRVNALRFAISQKALQAIPGANPDEGSSARLMRNGLAVIAFCCVEDFVKQRAAEVANIFGHNGVKFVNLPESMKRAATISAAEGMINSARRLDKAMRPGFVQSVAKDIVSTTGAGYQISKFAFGHGKSNLASDDVSGFARCFGVSDFWNQVSQLSNKLGYGGAVNYFDSFTNAALMRHSAAHEPGFDAEIGDLNDWLDQAMAIAVSYDLLISQRANEILVGKSALADNGVACRIKIRVIYTRGGASFAEHAPGREAGRAFRVGSDLDSVFDDAMLRANTNKEMLVAFNTKQQPMRWHSG